MIDNVMLRVYKIEAGRHPAFLLLFYHLSYCFYPANKATFRNDLDAILFVLSIYFNPFLGLTIRLADLPESALDRLLLKLAGHQLSFMV